MSSTRPLCTLVASAALVAVALIAPGCENLFEDQDAALPPDMFVDNASLAGRWTISGTGDLTCPADPSSDIDDFRLEAASFTVEQDEDGTLTMVTPPPSDGEFAFEDGLVNGLLVDFVTREVAGGQTIRLAFDGRANEVGNIAGRFTGQGPSTCTSRGDFVVEIRR